ncbi:GNAT family N-acetyltransferase [Ruminococcus albus]|uniref:Acetyltransferase (GNAT) domain-containing protein n=1 Tax=Ruminococcus albus TaxID=1264 RepID=A0A1I1DVE3_RUMAL|nr:GNAT family N-acetyltransferase [Ruminococcus albus]SFB76690.1 Acetyltransferase (GNAT) domain-containing protein [Ruminococcus albus]
MKIIEASCTDLSTIKDITHSTIKAVYPRYYPSGAVDFFLKYHSEENIAEDIRERRTFLCIDDYGNKVGTVTIKENDIGRLFVLPEFQGKGYGKALLDFAENVISRSYSDIILDASLAAKKIYIKRGYTEIEYKTVMTDNGDFLCWDIMIKKVKEK